MICILTTCILNGLKIIWFAEKSNKLQKCSQIVEPILAPSSVLNMFNDV